MANLSNLRGLVTQLQQGGLNTQVQSWLGSGQNLSVTPGQLRTALGNEQVKQLGQYFGIDPGAGSSRWQSIFRQRSIKQARAGHCNRRRNAHHKGGYANA